MVGSITKEEAVAKAVERLKAYPQTSGYTGGTGGQNAFYGSISISGELKENNYPCHMYMKTYEYSLVCFSKYVVAQACEPVKDRFFNLLMGPTWAGVSKYWKYNDEVKGWINSDTDKTPANYQHNFLVATRSIAEWPAMILEWDHLVTKLKINPAVAYWFLVVFFSGRDNCAFPNHTRDKTAQVRKSLMYDWCLDVQTYPDEAFKLFVEGKPIESSFIQAYYVSPKYIPVNAIWSPNPTNIEDRYMFKLQERYKHIGKIAKSHPAYSKTPLNAFVYQDWTMTYEEMIEIIKRESLRLSSTVATAT